MKARKTPGLIYGDRFVHVVIVTLPLSHLPGQVWQHEETHGVHGDGGDGGSTHQGFRAQRRDGWRRHRSDTLLHTYRQLVNKIKETRLHSSKYQSAEIPVCVYVKLPYKLSNKMLIVRPLLKLLDTYAGVWLIRCLFRTVWVCTGQIWFTVQWVLLRWGNLSLSSCVAYCVNRLSEHKGELQWLRITPFMLQEWSHWNELETAFFDAVLISGLTQLYILILIMFWLSYTFTCKKHPKVSTFSSRSKCICLQNVGWCCDELKQQLHKTSN